MKSKCLLLLFSLLTLCVVPMVSQSITLTKEFETMPNVSALDIYRNQFGMYEIVGADDPFPYAVIRVGLDGTPEEVKEAKKRLSFQLGRVTTVEIVFKDARNELLFLVPTRARNIQMSCDGECLPQMMFDSLVTLQSNTIFYGRVHFSLEDENRDPNQLRDYMYTLRVAPAHATVEIRYAFAKQKWPLSDGVTEQLLKEGTYHYTISAVDYKTAEGTLVVDSLHTDTTITLEPRFGWMSIKGDSSDLTNLSVDMVYNKKMQTYSLPIDSQKYLIGVYTLAIKKDKYHTWKRIVVVHPGEHLEVSPALLPKVYRHNTFILAQGAYAFNPAWSAGLMFGQVYGEVTNFCGIGWFVKGRSNFQNLKTPTLTAITDNGLIGSTRPAYTGNTRFGTWHVNAGVVLNFLNKQQLNLHKNSMLGLYAGLGYGQYMRQWEYYNPAGEERWLLFEPESTAGVSYGAGIIGSIKGVTLSAGVNFIMAQNMAKYMEIEAGIGWTF